MIKNETFGCGRAALDLIRDKPEENRNFVLIGRERNDVLARPGSPAGLGYPARGIRLGNLLYIHNYEPNRWPCGDPDLGLKDTDDGPTKRFITALGAGNTYWQFVFGKHPVDELYDLSNDPDCVKNLASSPEYADKLKSLNETMTAELIKQNDPRALGHGDVFDNYPSPKATKE